MAKHVEDLLVWKLCDQVRRRVREIVARPAWREHPTLRRQLEDAAESPCPNLHEGFERYHPKENGRFVRIAKASLKETVEHLDAAVAKGLATPKEAGEIIAFCNRGRAAAVRLIRYLESATAPNVPRTRPKEARTTTLDKQEGQSKAEPEIWTDERANASRWRTGR